MIDEGDIVGDTCFGSKVLEVGDTFLKPIVHNAVRAFEEFLSELGELKTSGCLGIVGEESGLKVGGEFVKGFLRVGNGSIRHPVIPHFREGDSLSLAHLVKRGHDLVGVRGVNRGVDGEVGFHGLNSSYCIGGFS